MILNTNWACMLCAKAGDSQRGGTLNRGIDVPSAHPPPPVHKLCHCRALSLVLTLRFHYTIASPPAEKGRKRFDAKETDSVTHFPITAPAACFTWAALERLE